MPTSAALRSHGPCQTCWVGLAAASAARTPCPPLYPWGGQRSHVSPSTGHQWAAGPFISTGDGAQLPTCGAPVSGAPLSVDASKPGGQDDHPTAGAGCTGRGPSVALVLQEHGTPALPWAWAWGLGWPGGPLPSASAPGGQEPGPARQVLFGRAARAGLCGLLGPGSLSQHAQLHKRR